MSHPVIPRCFPLLDEASRKQLPPLYWAEDHNIGLDALALIKFFTPDSNWTWYASEFDGTDTFFGLVDGLEIEIGYFSLQSLELIRGQFGLPVERDQFYCPKTLRVLLEELKHQRR